MNEESKPLIVIIGETASGKSALAMELAQKFNGEIICADSRTVYVGMDIGTAKPSIKDQQKVPHFGINISTPVTPVNVADFKKLATGAMAEIASRGHVPIMVGGTGLYIDAVLYDFVFRKVAERKLRDHLGQLSVPELQAELQAEGIALPENSQNPRHLMRALETGGQTSERKPLRANTLIIGLEVPRDELKARIARRIDQMLAAGLEAEVRQLAQKYGWDVEPLKTIGYREWREYFEGQVSLEQVKAEIIRSTMAYAKRQRTWFKRNSSIHWVKEQREVVELVTTFLNKSRMGK